MRNLGQTAHDRALNFAATNAFQAASTFAEAVARGMELDTIEVEKSPFCRLDSDCWDVKLKFLDEERTWLEDVSCVPLQQSVIDLETAFKKFFDSCKRKTKGQKVRHPRFKKRTSSQSARFTLRGFSMKKNGATMRSHN